MIAMKDQQFKSTTIRYFLFSCLILAILELVFFKSTGARGHSAREASDAIQSSRWQITGKEARIALYEGRFKDAVAGYERAILTLPPQGPVDDVRIDLMLGKAESYRIWKRLPDSERILDQVELELDKGKRIDPTLPIRYWRRRSDLLFDQGYILKSVEAREKALEALQNHFAPASEHFIKSSEELIARLVNDRHYSVLFQFMKRLMERIPENQAVDELVERYYRQHLAQIRLRAGEMITSGELEQARALIDGLQNIDRRRVGLGVLWLQWLSTCLQAKETRLLGNADEKLTSLIAFYGNRTGKVAWREKLQCHVALDLLYKEKFQPDKQDAQIMEAIRLIKLLGSEATSQEHIYLIKSYSRQAAELVKSNPKSPGALSYTRMMAEASRMPPKGIQAEHLETYYKLHCSSRIRLSGLYLLAGKLEEAQRTLSAINQIALNSLDMGNLRVAQSYINLADACIDSGKKDKARSYLNRASAYLSSAKDYSNHAGHSRLKQTMDKLHEVRVKLESANQA